MIAKLPLIACVKVVPVIQSLAFTGGGTNEKTSGATQDEDSA